MAGTTPGIYTVTATSRADNTKSASVTVTVANPSVGNAMRQRAASTIRWSARFNVTGGLVQYHTAGAGGLARHPELASR